MNSDNFVGEGGWIFRPLMNRKWGNFRARDITLMLREGGGIFAWSSPLINRLKIANICYDTSTIINKNILFIIISFIQNFQFRIKSERNMRVSL